MCIMICEAVTPRRGVMAAILALAACTSDATDPGGGGAELPQSPVTVSAPLAGAPQAASFRGLRALGPVYVSMSPGTEPAGVQAEIRGLRRPEVQSVNLVDGGFDPVTVTAAPGDTLEVTVIRTTGQRIRGYREVPGRSRPGVVRVSPANRRTSVPLNTIIRVVFTEPMDSASVAGALRLSTGGASVAATVTLDGVTGAILTPTGPLAGPATYQVDLAAAARSVGGGTLPDPVRWTFVTADPGAVPPPPDTTGPLVTILNPGPGESLSAEYPIFRISVNDPSGVSGIEWHVLDPGGGPPSAVYSIGWTMQSGTATYSIGPVVSSGTHTFEVAARDSLGNTGRSAPVTVTLVPSDPTPRILVRSFVVVEDQVAPGFWSYSPQAVVADAAGQGGVEIVGFEMLSLPGLSSPFPRSTAAGITVPAGQDVPLFAWLYGDWELSYSAFDGHRSSGGQANARLTYRDPQTGKVYSVVLLGDIMPGPWPPTVAVSCSRWYGLFQWAQCPI